MMMRFAAVLATAAVAGFLPPGAYADAERASEAEAAQMVKKAVAFYKKNGKEKTISELMKSPGPFVDRDLYVTLYTLDGILLAHINQKIVGKNLIELRDPDGKPFVRERMEAARASESGWQDYKFFNPVSKKVEPKRMYWEKHDGFVFACGAYKKT
jgi:signal transduction histidine kinase